MKRLLFFLLSLSIYFSATVYAFDCENIYGTWQGALNGLKSVRLSIHPFDGEENAKISFKDGSGVSLTYGLFVGSCQQNSDGTISMHLTRNSYGVNSNIDVQLTSINTLKVDAFSYSDYMNSGGGSGTLSK